jgi:hypothetical protein
MYPNVNRPLLLAAALVALLGSAAGAATITVDTDLDADAADGVCSIREAILAANSDAARNECPAGDGADHIHLAFSTPDAIFLTDHLPAITESLAIHGSGVDLVILDGSDSYRAITVESPSNGISLVVQDLTLRDGRTRIGDFGGGGAMIDGGASALFERVVFVSNSSVNAGGGMVVGSGGAGGESHVTLVECTFRENVAEGPAGGGGLATTGTGSAVDVLRSVFADNQATLSAGGGIVALDSFITVEESTISGNSATIFGGGIWVGTSPESGASLLIRDTTITDNTCGTSLAVGDGGGLYLSPGPDHPLAVSLENSVVAGNLDLVGIEQPDLFCGTNLAAFAATGSSLIGANDGCEAFFPAGSPNANGDFVGTVAAPLAPLLLPLADNGGPTPTHRPILTLPFLISPLIDRGSCPDIGADQRGFGDLAAGLRRVDLVDVPTPPGGDGCDIGAFEVGADPLFDDLIFADGFELGHALRWHSETP